MPFELPMAQTEVNRIRNADIDDIAPHLSAQFFEIIRSLLHPDPNQRQTAAGLVQAIEEIM
jgi:hypothetical protein